MESINGISLICFSILEFIMLCDGGGGSATLKFNMLVIQWSRSEDPN